MNKKFISLLILIILCSVPVFAGDTIWSVHDQIQSLGSSGDNELGSGGMVYSLINNSFITASSVKFALNMTCPLANSPSIEVSFCERFEDNEYSFDCINSTRVNVTVAGGTDWTCTAGTNKISDNITMTLDSSKNYVFNYHMDSSAEKYFRYRDSFANILHGAFDDTGSDFIGKNPDGSNINKADDVNVIASIIDNSVGTPTVDGPTFVSPTPASGETNFTLPVINVSCGANTIFLWFDTTQDPTTTVIDNSTVGNYSPDSLTSGTLYNYKAACYNNSAGAGLFSSNSSIRNFTFDSVAPSITSSLEGNLTHKLSEVSFSMNISDDNIIWKYNISIDGVLYNETINIVKDFYTANFTLDISQNSTGPHTVEFWACDAHTTTNIPDFVVEKREEDKQLKYKFGSDYIQITPKDESLYSEYDTTKLKDRYTFKYTPDSTVGEYTFIVESTHKISLLDSNFQGHLVISDLDKWVDFHTGNPSITVKSIEVINDYKVEITIDNPENKKMYFKSVGSLNCYQQDYLFYKFGETLTYSGQTIEQVLEPFTLTLALNNSIFNSSNISAVLFYNNTKINVTQNGFVFSTNVITPNITQSSEQIPFYWEYNISTFNYNTTINNQVIGKFLLTECSAEQTTHTLNITFYNASSASESIFADTLEMTFDVIGIAGGNRRSFSFSNSTLANFSLCIFPNSTLVTDFQIDFSRDLKFFSYFQEDINLSNETKTLSLFIQSNTEQITYTVKDEFDNIVEGAFITVERYTVGTNSYETVEVLKTNAEGETVGGVVLFTDWYRFTITINGIVKLVDGPTKLTETSKVFRINTVGGDWYDKFISSNDIIHSLYFNNVTNNFVLTWSDPTLKLQKICLRVDNHTTTTETIVNGGDSCSTSQSGTLLVNVGTQSQRTGSTFIGHATALVSGSDSDFFQLGILELVQLDEFKFYDRDDSGIGQLAAFIMVSTLGFIGIWNPVIAIVFILIGFFAMYISGFFYMGWPAIMSLIVIGGLLIYKFARAK